MMNGCGSEEVPATDTNIHIPANVDSLENVAFYSLEEQIASADTVELIREAVFESSEEVFLEGYIGKMAVDDQDRIYIVSSNPGTVHIYVFEPNGEFITKFYREGRGRGESESIASIKIKDDKIYLLGSRLKKVLVYSAQDYSFIRDAVFKRDSVRDKMSSLLRASDLFIDDKHGVILKFKNFYIDDSLDKIFYHKISEKGQILPDQVFSQKRYDLNHYKQDSENREFGMLVITLPFHRSSLFVMSDSGYIYDAWTEDFLIKVHDPEGNYQRAIYYPFDHSMLETEKLDIYEGSRETFEGVEVPDTWPAIHQMRVDDEERLWIATITDSDSTYQWYVLDSDGEMKAQFEFPGIRSYRSPMLVNPTFPIIKNGYFYAPEKDEYGGNIRVTKYRISFKPK
jgi:hypothetical protein